MKAEKIKKAEIQIQIYHDAKNTDLEKRIRHILVRVESTEDRIIMIKIHPDLADKIYQSKSTIILSK